MECVQISLADHWNSCYDKGADFGLITSQSLSQILENVNPTLPKFCLDIGCGTGQLTRELYHRGYSCLGIDISDSALAKARNNTVYSDKLMYLKGNIETIDTLKLPRKTYSLITCKLVYAFIEDKRSFLESVHELLEDDGTFAMITPLNSSGESRPIAVDIDETMDQLKTTFSDITTFDGLNVTYFICHK